MARTRPAGQGWSYGWSFVELFAVSGIAIAQPYLDVTAKNRELLVTHGATWSSAVPLALGVALLPPAAGVLAERILATIWARAVPVLHAVLCGALVAVLAIEVVKPRTGLGPAALVGIAVLLGVIGALLVATVKVARVFLHWLALGSLAFVPLFLFASPATAVLSPSSAAPVVTAPARTPHRVVMVVLDELPTMSLLDGSGHIDRSLFPNLAGFADDAVWYRNHVAVAGFTQSSVPGILSGRYPNATALPTVEAYPKNLFTFLGDRAELNVHEAITRLCPEHLCARNDGHDFGSLVSATSDLWAQFASPHRFVRRFVDTDAARGSVASGENFVRTLHRTHGMHLDFVHLEIPHYPWERLPDLRRYDVPADPPGESYSETPSTTGAETARMRHLMQLQAADTLVGRIERRLRQLGQYDDSMVIVTADHGVAFTPGQYVRIATPVTYPQVMWAPLLVKYPGASGQGRVDDRPAQSIDVVPTIADVIGLRIPWSVDGTSLRAAPVYRPTRRFYSFYWADAQKQAAANGSVYVDAGSTADFRSMISARSVPPGGDPSLRTYRIGPYGSLVGRPVARQKIGRASPAVASIVDPGRLAHITMHTDPLPWVWNQAVLTHATPGAWYTIESEGTVLAVAQGIAYGDHRVSITFLIPPRLVHPGAVHLRMHQLAGPAAAPTLAPVAIH